MYVVPDPDAEDSQEDGRERFVLQVRGHDRLLPHFPPVDAVQLPWHPPPRTAWLCVAPFRGPPSALAVTYHRVIDHHQASRKLEALLEAMARGDDHPPAALSSQHPDAESTLR